MAVQFMLQQINFLFLLLDSVFTVFVSNCQTVS